MMPTQPELVYPELFRNRVKAKLADCFGDSARNDAAHAMPPTRVIPPPIAEIQGRCFWEKVKTTDRRILAIYNNQVDHLYIL